MSDLALAGAEQPAPPAARTAAELAAGIPVPRRLPERYDGEPLRHLSPSSYSLWVACPEAWRRRHIKGQKPPPSGSMFLGIRIDDALSACHRRILEHGDRSALDQVLDLYREQWHSELEAERDKQGIDWDEDLPERAAFELGRHAIELAMSRTSATRSTCRLEDYPASELLFAQIAKPGKRRKRMSTALVTTGRTVGQMRGVLARVALAASQIAAAYERYGPDQLWGFADGPAGAAARGTAGRGGAAQEAAGSEPTPKQRSEENR